MRVICVGRTMAQGPERDISSANPPRYNLFLCFRVWSTRRSPRRIRRNSRNGTSITSVSTSISRIWEIFSSKAPNGTVIEIIPSEGSQAAAEHGEQQESRHPAPGHRGGRLRRRATSISKALNVTFLGEPYDLGSQSPGVLQRWRRQPGPSDQARERRFRNAPSTECSAAHSKLSSIATSGSSGSAPSRPASARGCRRSRRTGWFST